MISLKFHHKSVFGYIQGDSDWALKSPEQARQGWPSLWRGTVPLSNRVASAPSTKNCDCHGTDFTTTYKHKNP